MLFHTISSESNNTSKQRKYYTKGRKIGNGKELINFPDHYSAGLIFHT